MKLWTLCCQLSREYYTRPFYSSQEDAAKAARTMIWEERMYPSPFRGKFLYIQEIQVCPQDLMRLLLGSADLPDWKEQLKDLVNKKDSMIFFGERIHPKDISDT
jgi:hypothetical protein